MRYNYKMVLFACLSCFILCCKQKDPDLNQIIGHKIAASISDTVQVNLSEITNVEFDHYMILPPYSNLTLISKEIGINLNIISNSGIQERDDIYVLCLSKQNKIVQYYILERRLFVFPEILNPQLLSGNVKLEIVKTENKNILKTDIE